MARPVSDFARQAAKAAGRKRYQGAACEMCGGTERFTSSRMCAVCLPRKTHFWRAKNAEHLRLYAQLYQARNAGRISAAHKAYRTEHVDERRAACSLWKKKNPHRNTAIQMKRKAAKTHRTPPWLTQAQEAEIDGVYHFARIMTRITGREYHVDHVVPLQGRAVSGFHVPWNLQVIPALENQRKSNSFAV